MKGISAFLTWQRVPAQGIEFKDLRTESLFFLRYAVFYVLLAILIGWLIVKMPLPILGAGEFVQDFWYAIVFKIFFLLLIPAIVYFRIWCYSAQDLLLGINPTTWGWIKGAALIVLGFLLNARHLSGILDQLPEFADANLRLALGIVLPFFIAGLPEELFFRGYLQTRLERLWNAPVAILASAVLFTAWHLPSRYFLASGIEGNAGDLTSLLLGTGVPVFLVSLFFGWHWARYRNLPLLILVHWAIDILPSLSSFFQIKF